MPPPTKSASRGRAKSPNGARESTSRRRTSGKPVGSSKAGQVEIIVNVSNRETRIVLLEEDKLMEYRVEREERVVGSIFKGIVQNVLPGMDAAFIDIGLERNAF